VSYILICLLSLELVCDFDLRPRLFRLLWRRRCRFFLVFRHNDLHHRIADCLALLINYIMVRDLAIFFRRDVIIGDKSCWISLLSSFFCDSLFILCINIHIIHVSVIYLKNCGYIWLFNFRMSDQNVARLSVSIIDILSILSPKNSILASKWCSLSWVCICLVGIWSRPVRGKITNWPDNSEGARKNTSAQNRYYTWS